MEEKFLFFKDPDDLTNCKLIDWDDAILYNPENPKAFNPYKAEGMIVTKEGKVRQRVRYYKGWKVISYFAGMFTIDEMFDKLIDFHLKYDKE